MEKLIVIVPTRGRLQNSLRLFEAFKKTSTVSKIVFAIDFDDTETYQPLVSSIYGDPKVEVVVGKTQGMNATLNYWAKVYSVNCDFVGFMGDDHLPKTDSWDQLLIESIGDRIGVAYGNDLLQQENLPTAVVMSSVIVSTLGWMAPPKLKHLYLDNFWLNLGKELGNLNYLKDVIVEHLHYVNGKAQSDERYEVVNSSDMYNHDLREFEKYMKKKFRKDLTKLKKIQ